MHLRRRIDHLPDRGPLDAAACSDERALRLPSQLVGAGFASASLLHVDPVSGDAQIVEHCRAHEHGPARGAALELAVRAARRGSQLAVLDTRERRTMLHWHHAATCVGAQPDGTAAVLVVSDPQLARRDGEAIALWAAPPKPIGSTLDREPCADLTHALARDLDADAVIVALFARAGMLLTLHTRAGVPVRSWRAPIDTVWGEVARHGAAFTLGDLPLHPGAEALGAVGMRAAAMVGIENGNGIAVGAVGVAHRRNLDIDVAHELLARSPDLGPQLMQRMSSTRVPTASEDGSIDLAVLAARVGCARFAVYRLGEGGLRISSVHAQDGARVTGPSDGGEETTVRSAYEQGVFIADRSAAAIRVGGSLVLYASDPQRDVIERLRLALGDVRRNPFGSTDDLLDTDADAA